MINAAKVMGLDGDPSTANPIKADSKPLGRLDISAARCHLD